ncbi:hypothetical protein P4238_01270 [Pseudomonas aeruginosa]|nr:hypothetical protein [Pseudomonas aeruginosa]
MHDPVSPLRVFDEGSWLFRQMVQAQPFIRQSGMVLAELGLLPALGLGYLCWQDGSRWYAVGAGFALLGSLLLVVVRHNYDWWLFKLGPRGRLYIPSTEAEHPAALSAPFMAARSLVPAGGLADTRAILPTALESRT